MTMSILMRGKAIIAWQLQRVRGQLCGDLPRLPRRTQLCPATDLCHGAGIAPRYGTAAACQGDAAGTRWCGDPWGRYGADNRVSDRLLTKAFEKVMRCFG
jgi:hypothetical protein